MRTNNITVRRISSRREILIPRLFRERRKIWRETIYEVFISLERASLYKVDVKYLVFVSLEAICVSVHISGARVNTSLPQ